MPHLGLALIFVFVVEELIPTQHKPSLLPVLHDAPLLPQPAGFEYRAQLVGDQGPPWAPALFPHHQALGASWKARTHTVSVEKEISTPSRHLSYAGARAGSASSIHFPLVFPGHMPEQLRSSLASCTWREVYNLPSLDSALLLRSTILYFFRFIPYGEVPSGDSNSFTHGLSSIPLSY